MNMENLLKELVDATDEYNRMHPENVSENPTPELQRYWDALCNARNYINRQLPPSPPDRDTTLN